MRMRRVIASVLGTALIVAGAAGIVFSVLGLVALAQVQVTVQQALVDQLDLLDRATGATAEGLELAAASLGQAANTVRSLESTLVEVSSAFGDSQPTFDALGTLLGKDLPGAIQAAQETLETAAVGARSVDDALRLVSALPFIGTGRYDPEVPLSQGLASVAASLEGVPESLRTAGRGLADATTTIQALEEDTARVGSGLEEIALSLESSRSVLGRYQSVTSDVQRLLTSTLEAIPGWLRALRFGLSLMLIWLGIAQVALITQGWELLSRSRHPVKQQQES